MYSGLKQRARSMRTPEATSTSVDAGDRAGFRASKLNQRAVVGAEQLADLGMDAREPLADRLDLGPGAAHLVHVGRGAADIGDDAREKPGSAPILPDLVENRLLRSRD